EGSRRGYPRLAQRRRRRDSAGRSGRAGAYRRAARHHGDSSSGASGRARALLKLATWNVNGIRARQAEVQDWIDRERPDVVCLQEIKATADQIPMFLCAIEGYWCYWHGGKGYSGGAVAVSHTFAPEQPAFLHPEFDYENRIVSVTVGDLTVASVYVPTGGKDFPTEQQLRVAVARHA